MCKVLATHSTGTRTSTPLDMYACLRLSAMSGLWLHLGCARGLRLCAARPVCFLVFRSPMASTLVPIHSDVCGACFRVAGGPASVLCAPLRDAVLHFAGEFVFDMRASHWLHTSFRDERCGHECGGEDLIVASPYGPCAKYTSVHAVATDWSPRAWLHFPWVTTSTICGRGDLHLRCERREYCVLFRR